MKKHTILISILLMVMTLFGCTTVQDNAARTQSTAVQVQSFESGITEIMKYGNIVLDINANTLLNAGYEYGDVVKVTVNGHEHLIPFCTNYSDVDTGSMVIRVKDESVIVAVNMGDFAKDNDIAVKQKHKDGSYEWIFPEGRTLESYTVKLEMAEKGGYKEEYLIHQLERTNERADYDADDVFANFREITLGKLGKGALYRSSSPINNELGRASYADRFARECGIMAVMNLADNAELIEGYRAADDFNSPYYYALYKDGAVIALNLGVDFKADDFKKGLAEGLRFFAVHEGPYLVHCTEGKDRAGFTSALLSAFMGATFDEVVEDYMKSYENYYHVERNSEQWRAVRNSNIIKQLELITGSTTPEKEDLSKASENYMKEIGLTESEIQSLRENLSKNYR